MKEEGGLGASKELREKYRNNPAFSMNDDQSLKRAKIGEDGDDEIAAVGGDVFTLPEEKPDLTDLRIEPKEYFKFIKSQKKHLSLRESDG